MLAERRLAVITAIAEELAPLLARASGLRRIPIENARAYTGVLAGRPVVLARTGDGQYRAERGMKAILARPEVAGWVGAGLAGALSPGLAPGAILVAREVWGDDGPVRGLDEGWARRVCELPGARPATFRSTGRIAASASDKTRLRDAASGASWPSVTVEMESDGWLRAARPTSAPGVLVRVVSDSFDEEIPEFVSGSLADDGSVNRGRILFHAMTHPSAVGKLLGMRRRTRFCAERLADFLEQLVYREWREP
jgi:nucleoside phosphorylase